MTATNYSSTDDLLRIFNSFSINRGQAIMEPDLKFCEQQQELLYTTLDGIQRWYGIFCEEAAKYAESHVLSFKTDGTLTFRESHRDSANTSPDFKQFDFKPFEVMNSLMDNRKNAIHAFAGNIIRYFNSKYSISVTVPEMDKNLPVNFRPMYTDYTSLVEQHLQGRGFRETAEEELICRIHLLVHPYRSSIPPELKNDRIVFYRPFCIVASYHASQPAYRTDYGQDKRLDILCEGILFGSKTLLNGNSTIIQNFNYLAIDITRWYSLTFATGYAIKFYKNSRVDVRFPDAVKAKNCFEKLRLNRLENLINE